MKRIIPLMILCAAILISCQQKAKVAPVDATAEKAAIQGVIDKQYTALKSHDLNAYAAFYSDNAVILGTDPSEFWTKAQFIDLGKQMFADTSLNFNLKPDKSEIYISSGGNSAIYVDQTLAEFISRKVQTRRICHLNKTDASWMIDFDSNSMIPKNEELPVIDKALEGEGK